MNFLSLLANIAGNKFNQEVPPAIDKIAKDPVKGVLQAAYDIAAPAPLQAALYSPDAEAMFIGNKAKAGFDYAKLMPAYKAVREGLSADDLWKKLGVYFGADGKTRQEISDAGAKLKNPGPLKDGVRPKVSDYLDHHELAKAYPDLMSYPAFPTATGSTRGSFDPNSYNIVFPSLDRPDSLSTLLHEFQHAIQNKEGFARGGNPREFPPADKLAHRLTLVEEGIKDIAAVKTGQATKRLIATGPNEYVDVTKDTAPEDLQALFKKLSSERKELKKVVGVDSFESYMRLHGEAESRATQNRMFMNEDARRLFGPSTFYDRSADKLIIKK